MTVLRRGGSSLFGLGQGKAGWKKGRLAPNGLGAGPTGEEEGGCLPFKNYGETQTAAFSHLNREVLRVCVWKGGSNLRWCRVSSGVDETDDEAPEEIAGPHLLTSSQLRSKRG